MKKLAAAIASLIILILIVLMILDYNNKVKEKDNKYDKATKEIIDSLRKDDSIKLYKDIPEELTWHTYDKKDEMSGNVIKFASLKSINYINQRFPYEGDTYMEMTIRRGKTTDVYFVIDRGQIQCSEYNGTDRINIKFDDEQPITFRTSEAQSGSSDIIFLSGNTKRFIEKCKKSKQIKVQIPIYEYGQAVFEFQITKPLE